MRRLSQVQPNIDIAELDFISECIEQNWLSEGPKTKQLVERIKDYTRSEYAIMAPNGTLGLYVALLSCGLEKGKKIIIPSFTFYATASALIFAGFIPKIIDVNPLTYEMDTSILEGAICEDTVAVMPVHIYGHCANMSEILRISRKRNLVVIEDAAQAMGVTYKGKHAGTIGDVGVISFFSDKTITMGEGAVILTNSEDIFSRIKYIRNQGRENSGTFVHEELGMNFRITDLQSAVGLSQLKKLPGIISSRLIKYNEYKKNLQNVGDISFGLKEPDSSFVPFRFYFTSLRKDEIQKSLELSGYETRSYFHPMHLQPKLLEYVTYSCPVSEEISLRGLCLPIHDGVTKKDIKDICSIIKRHF